MKNSVERAQSEPTDAEQASTQRLAPDFRTLTLAPDKSESNRTKGLSRLLTSPRVVTALVPLLVFALGLTLTLVGQIALGNTSRSMAQERFVSHTRAAHLRLSTTLAQADPLLDELCRIAEIARSIPSPNKGLSEPTPGDPSDEEAKRNLASTAFELQDLLVGRPGVTQVYIAFANGRFLSVDPEASKARFQITEEGYVTSYQVDGQHLIGEERRESEFEPRKREWYQQAEIEKTRVWSSPYSFFFSGHTGVTRAHPIYQDESKNELIAVVGVDFDVDTLTAFMAAGESHDDKVSSVAFTRKGVILAYPDGADRLARLPKDLVPTHQSLFDPALSALVQLAQATPFPSERALFKYSVNGERMLASVRTLGENGPPWFVATFATERDVLSDLYTHRKSSLAIGLLALLVACVLGWLLGRHLLTARQVISEARVLASRAHEKIRLLGSYRLEALLGEGGMGEVWRASHQLLAREAAIKLIKRTAGNGDDSERQRERFRREAQAIAGLRSRNTVDLYDYGVTPDGTLFYVMELLDGIDLNSLVKKYGIQPPGRVKEILIQATNSLSEAHERGLVHRDIKPANLFLCREANEVDVVKILDFGLVFQTHGTPFGSASETERPLPPLDTIQDSESSLSLAEQTRITHADHQLGTPAFMSPEQALGSQTDGRSDLYSLACVAWWMLTGAPPFRAETALAVMHKHVEDPVPRLSDVLEQEVPEDLAQVIERCLAKSPLDRPQSAEELQALLHALNVENDRWEPNVARQWWNENLPLKAQELRRRAYPLRDVEVLGPDTPEGREEAEQSRADKI